MTPIWGNPSGVGLCGYGLPEEPRAGLGPNPVVAEKVGHSTNLGWGY